MAEEASASGVTDQPTTKRLDFKKQSLDDAYAAPANLLEIEVGNADTHGLARNRYTDYEVKMRVGPYFGARVSRILAPYPMCVCCTVCVCTCTGTNLYRKSFTCVLCARQHGY